MTEMNDTDLEIGASSMMEPHPSAKAAIAPGHPEFNRIRAAVPQWACLRSFQAVRGEMLYNLERKLEAMESDLRKCQMSDYRNKDKAAYCADDQLLRKAADHGLTLQSRKLEDMFELLDQYS